MTKISKYDKFYETECHILINVTVHYETFLFMVFHMSVVFHIVTLDVATLDVVTLDVVTLNDVTFHVVTFHTVTLFVTLQMTSSSSASLSSLPSMMRSKFLALISFRIVRTCSCSIRPHRETHRNR